MAAAEVKPADTGPEIKSTRKPETKKNYQLLSHYRFESEREKNILNTYVFLAFLF